MELNHAYPARISREMQGQQLRDVGLASTRWSVEDRLPFSTAKQCCPFLGLFDGHRAVLCELFERGRSNWLVGFDNRILDPGSGSEDRINLLWSNIVLGPEFSHQTAELYSTTFGHHLLIHR